MLYSFSIFNFILYRFSLYSYSFGHKQLPWFRRGKTVVYLHVLGVFIVAVEHVCKWTGGWWDFYIIITSLSLDFCFNDWLSVHKTSSIPLHNKTQKAYLYLFSSVLIHFKNPQLFDTIIVFLLAIVSRLFIYHIFDIYIK